MVAWRGMFDGGHAEDGRAWKGCALVALCGTGRTDVHGLARQTRGSQCGSDLCRAGFRWARAGSGRYDLAIRVSVACNPWHEQKRRSGERDPKVVSVEQGITHE